MKTQKTSNTPAREVQFLNHDIEIEMAWDKVCILSTRVKAEKTFHSQ